MWVRVDDGMHAHRKTRAVTKSHPEKRRDCAPMGLWVLAASWAGRNGTEGWVPEDELDRWDDDWAAMVRRLIQAGYWWPHEREGEPGYGFNDWHDYNDPADAASKAGTFGNHVRWHVNESKVDPACDHCPSEPDRGDIGGRSLPDSPPDSQGETDGDGGTDDSTDVRRPSLTSQDEKRSTAGQGVVVAPRSGGESQLGSGAIALPEPDPNPTRPLPPTAGRAVALRSGGDAAQSPTAQTLVGEWIDHCADRPPGRVVGQVAKELKTLLDEGIEPDRIRRALAEWNRKGLHPSTLPSVVHEIANRAPGVRGQQATDDMFDRAMRRAIEREAATQ